MLVCSLGGSGPRASPQLASGSPDHASRNRPSDRMVRGRSLPHMCRTKLNVVGDLVAAQGFGGDLRRTGTRSRGASTAGSILDALDTRYSLSLCDVWGASTRKPNSAGVGDGQRWKGRGARFLVTMPRAPRRPYPASSNGSVPRDAYDRSIREGRRGSTREVMGRPIGFLEPRRLRRAQRAGYRRCRAAANEMPA